MMRVSDLPAGFTLIELLIVMTIVMTSAALVGGLSVDFIDKYKTNAEIIELRTHLSKAQELAFVSERKLRLTADQQELKLFDDSRLVLAKKFAILEFDRQNLLFNAAGLVSSPDFQYRVENRQYQISLAYSHE